MRQYNAFSAIPLSFFSGGLYRDVARNWRGIGFWYLVLIMLLTTIVPVVKLHTGLGDFARNEFPKVAKDFPEFSIKNGEVSSGHGYGTLVWATRARICCRSPCLTLNESSNPVFCASRRGHRFTGAPQGNFTFGPSGVL